MRLPDGSILMITDPDTGLQHAYDAVKAHEYYMRNRELKGRKKGKIPPPSTPRKGSLASVPEQMKKVQAQKKFIESLPMVQDGAKPEEATKFVKSLRGKTDDELRQWSKALKEADAKVDGPSPHMAQAQTIDFLLKNRDRTRKSKRSSKEVEVQKANAVKRVASLKKQLVLLKRNLSEKMAEARQAERKAKKGPTRAEKSEKAREAKKYRDKNQQKLKSKGKADASKQKSEPKKDSVESIKSQIAKVEGKLAAAVEQQKTLSKAT